ncbi:hypothetical protein [Adhaeribacter pallidiroseus]|uniref:Coenzyme Q-binding protein COQ10 START domain-containing protein n=1 Tax=Adhaeribacter pallidiroseus TaxID=2072847 RepID=A0A369QJJ0_9BACT|nr:hypothetical protein [Adhaeribacter pallidiroseus]RDC64470.1 hypothetical protein AHMF7616_03084 [Adhaeribacter pallidiroseus]
MPTANRHIVKTIAASIEINGKPEVIWQNITEVKIEQFSDPLLFRLLDVPKPLSAEIIAEGAGGQRIAYFSTGKKFIQEIIIWKPLEEYSFSFNPEEGFRVGYFFELKTGIFRMLKGAYFLKNQEQSTTLKLTTEYSIDKRYSFLLQAPIKIILKAFQRYLLHSIKKNAES